MAEDTTLKRTEVQEEEARRTISNSFRSLQQCKSKLSFLDFNHIIYFVHNNIDKYKDNVTLKHAKKLFFLGGYYKPPTVNVNKAVFNLSDRILSRREKELLSLGLKHNFKPYVKEFQWQLSFELTVNKFQTKQQMPGESNEVFHNQLKQLYNKVIEMQKNEDRTTFYDKKDMGLLKRLGKNDNLIISEPDKGRGTVIMNKTDYIRKVENILNNENLFEKVKVDDPLKHTLLLEDRLNRNLKVWLNKGIMTETEYKDNYATGTRPGILYGLPKLHKENIPVRPVLSARKTPLYTFSKFLIQFIENFTSNEFTLKNNMQLVDDLKNLQLNSESYMVSYDIESLYTNIPIDETIQILLDQMNEENLVRNAEKKELKRMLLQATGNSYFHIQWSILQTERRPCYGTAFECTIGECFSSIS